MIKKTLTMLVLFTCFSITCFASSWYWIGNNHGANYWIDNESVQKDSDYAIIWAKVTDLPIPNNLYNAKEAKFKMYIKANGTGGWTYMQITQSDGHMIQYNNDLEIYPFPPDSLGYRVWQYVY